MASSSKIGERIHCLYCGKMYHSALSLAHHLDRQHQGWVENVLRKIGLDVPEVYPIPEYRCAIARSFAATPTAVRVE
jgi:hypothetical protein